MEINTQDKRPVSLRWLSRGLMVRRMIRTNRHTGDRIAAAILLAVSLVLLAMSIHYQLFQGSAPGPGLFPAIVAGILVLLSVLWLITGAGSASKSEMTVSSAHNGDREHPERTAVQSLAATDSRSSVGGSAATDVEESADAEMVSIDEAGARRILFVIGWTAIPLVFLERIGYLLTITIYVGGLLLVIARTRPWVGLLGALVGAALTEVGADRLGITLPDPLGLLQVFGL